MVISGWLGAGATGSRLADGPGRAWCRAAREETGAARGQGDRAGLGFVAGAARGPRADTTLIPNGRPICNRIRPDVSVVGYRPRFRVSRPAGPATDRGRRSRRIRRGRAIQSTWNRPFGSSRRAASPALRRSQTAGPGWPVSRRLRNSERFGLWPTSISRDSVRPANHSPIDSAVAAGRRASEGSSRNATPRTSATISAVLAARGRGLVTIRSNFTPSRRSPRATWRTRRSPFSVRGRSSSASPSVSWGTATPWRSRKRRRER